MWLTDKDIDSFLSKNDYDVRKSKNARWIDQKCTPDVLTIIADCVLNYISSNGIDKIFTSMDIWHSDYTVNNVLDIFKKPSPNMDEARNEYDKFFQQPLELLSYAKVITKIKKGSRNYYKVNDIDIIEYLALREKNSLNFLIHYIEKVLNDSGLLSAFNRFFEYQTPECYEEVKNTFTAFTISNTAINKPTECRRIFIKIINPLAFKNNSRGTERGRISTHKITYDMLMYNRDNFRDLNSNKPKEMTRKEYLAHTHRNTAAYFRYLTIKAKNVVREYNNKFNNGLSELGNNSIDKATHIHHIFPESQFPSISYYIENLIALTPTEHLNKAHVNGKTTIIDKNMQMFCLLAKSGTIQDSYINNREIYDFNNFMKVLDVGLNKDLFEKIPYLDFIETNRQINLIYNNL